MNVRAEKAFLALPKAIDQIDQGMVYSIDSGIAADRKFTMLRIDLTYLLVHYLNKGYIDANQVSSIRDQLESVDNVDWLMAFTIIHNLRHKQWQNDTVSPK